MSANKQIEAQVVVELSSREKKAWKYVAKMVKDDFISLICRFAGDSKNSLRKREVQDLKEKMVAVFVNLNNRDWQAVKEEINEKADKREAEKKRKTQVKEALNEYIKTLKKISAQILKAEEDNADEQVAAWCAALQEMNGDVNGYLVDYDLVKKAEPEEAQVGPDEVEAPVEEAQVEKQEVFVEESAASASDEENNE